MPRVSVVMPVHNCARYVGEAIDSILGQSFTDFEFIIIDDGSTDGTCALVEAAAATDPRIRLVSRENRGLTASLNEAIALARGEFIARMDGDDISEPERLARQVAFLDAQPRYVAVGCQIQLIDPKGRPLRVMRVPETHEELMRRGLRAEPIIWHPTALMRAGAATEIGGYDPRFLSAQDIDFFLRLSELAPVANLPEVLLKYRLHPASVGNAKRAEQAAAARRAAAAAAARRGLPAPPEPPDAAQQPAAQDLYRLWGWWALQGGEVRTARLYAAKALLRQPLSPGALRLAVCALRGH